MSTLVTAQGPNMPQGSSSGPPMAPVYGEDHKPITESGFVNSGPIVFKEIAASAGLTSWRHIMGTPEKSLILESTGSGVAMIDYDRDGWLDLYFVNGSTWEAEKHGAPAPHAALFHNNHDGTFTDVTMKAGVANERWGFAVAVGDYDNDGWPDMYVSNYGKNRLYHNNHDGTFTDVAERAGVTLGNWSTGATFGDYDGDGRLDLFVPGYVHFDMNHLPLSGTAEVNYLNCSFRGTRTMCGPRGLRGEPDHLFHNDGNGKFIDVSEKAGVSDKHGNYGFSSTFVDIDGDGRQDLLVTNDSSPNYLYRNKGDGSFDDISLISGFALNQQGRDQANMGLAIGDYLNNGMLDLYTGTFSDDYKPLFRNEGDMNFSEITPEMGLAAATYPFLTWATGFIDFDNDGWKDIFAVNGHVYPQADHADWGTSFRQRPLLFHNINHGTKFVLMPPVVGTGLAEVIPGRGAAFGDLFNDGRIDVVINNIDQSPSLLRNVYVTTNHWVGLQLLGGGRSPKDATGSTVYLTAGGIRQRGDVLSGGSYESNNDPRIHFGLGDATTIDIIEIHWTDGTVEKVRLPEVDRFYTIEQAKGIVSGVYDKPSRTSSNTK